MTELVENFRVSLELVIGLSFFYAKASYLQMKVAQVSFLLIRKVNNSSLIT